jgi:hypothetical protein
VLFSGDTERQRLCKTHSYEEKEERKKRTRKKSFTESVVGGQEMKMKMFSLFLSKFSTFFSFAF